jgi:hypothetical protein
MPEGTLQRPPVFFVPRNKATKHFVGSFVSDKSGGHAAIPLACVTHAGDNGPPSNY